MKKTTRYTLLLGALASGSAQALTTEPAVETLAPTTVYGAGQADPAPNGPIDPGRPRQHRQPPGAHPA